MSPSSRPAICFSRRRLKKQGNPSLRTGKNSTTDPHFLFKTVTRICSWRLKNRGNPPLRTGKNSTTYSHFFFQNKSSHLPLETEKTRKTEFESRLKQHGRRALFDKTRPRKAPKILKLYQALLPSIILILFAEKREPNIVPAYRISPKQRSF